MTIEKLSKPSELLAATGDEDIDKMLADCIKTFEVKGTEYTIGSVDRLANFRRVANEVGVRPEQAWFTFFYKHYCSVVAHIKSAGAIKSSEPIQGRVMDMIVYLLLFSKMLTESEQEKKNDKLDTPVSR